MKLTKRLLAMALAGVMLHTILTGCSGGKTGDRLVEEYMDTFLSQTFETYGFGDIPITHDVPEIKTVAEKFEASWLNGNGESGQWAISSRPQDADPKYTALQEVFNKYADGHYAVSLYACKVDSKQSELYQTMRVMVTTLSYGLPIHKRSTTSSTSAQPTAAKCATRLVTRGDKSYRIAVIIYDHHAVAVG